MVRLAVDRIALYRHADLVLGTFNAVLVALLAAAWAFLYGDLRDLGRFLVTLPGLVMVAGIWVLAWWSTGRAIRGWNIVPLPPWWETWQRGILHGARAGLIAMASVTTVLLALALVEDGLTLMFGMRAALVALYLPIWAVSAIIVGAAVGFVVATIDRIAVGLFLRT